MRKTLQKKRKQKIKIKRKTKKYKGGSYYAYNNNPVRFTRSTTQHGGMTLNTSDTLIPQSLVTLGRSFIHNASTNAHLGIYPAINPDPTVQPISKSYILGK